jgi:alanyl aminopeptidase
MCIRYASGDATEKSCFLLDHPMLDMKLSGKSCPSSVQLNDNASGYYQVDYKGELRQKLLSNQAVAHLSASERVDLMGNISSGVDAGRQPLTDELKLAELFHDDSESRVAQSAIGIAIQRSASFPVPKQWVPAKLATNYQHFVETNFGARAHQLGWLPKNGEPDDTALLRPSLLAAVAMYGGDQDLAKQAQDLATAWLADHSSVNANIVWPVLRTAAYFGDKSLMDRYLNTLKNTNDRQVRQDLLVAMVFFRDPEAVKIGMQSVLAGDVPLSDGGFYLLVLAGRASPATKKMPFEFIKAHYDEILAKRPPIGIFDYSSSFPIVGSSFCDAQSRAELKDFFDPRVDKLLGARHTLNETLEGIDICIATREAQLPSLEAFLSKY